MNTKRKYYVLSDEAIKHVKICALKEDISEHDLVNKILKSYKSDKE